MHEVALMQRTIEIALAHAAEAGAARIERITLRVGPLSGVVPEALAFAFDVAAAGTAAEGAALTLEQPGIVCGCAACGDEFEPADLLCQCPRCALPSLDVRRGRELELASLEVR